MTEPSDKKAPPPPPPPQEPVWQVATEDAKDYVPDKYKDKSE
ncbi:hypothetical protein [Vibrio parahaemolyticus]|nr:hypothetical protein [Vibrio parahaemolyticus]MDF4691881.1 hypothetical protein [Vibrio parahaemolyticus]